MRTLPLLLALGLLACRPTAEDPVHLDADGDGVDAGEDCNDDDAAVYPGATETCNGVDDDCNDIIDDDASDAPSWYRDGDEDGYGAGDDPVTACDAPNGYTGEDGDCDDADPAFHPGAAEADCADPSDYNCDGSVGYADEDGDGFAACEECDDTSADAHPDATEACNEVDDDCDGEIDEAGADGELTFYADADDDGYGDSESSTEACTAPDGYTDDASDCDDTTDAVHPGADERCNAADDDCDGELDEDAVDTLTWYADTDDDGYGDPAASAEACAAPDGHVDDATDCDDGQAAVHPGADEVCNGADDDCDDEVDEDAVDPTTWYADADGDDHGVSSDTTDACDRPDGYAADPGDCDDSEATVHPGATETWYDGTDQDCSGGSDFDRDGDGRDAQAEAGGSDCDDADPDTWQCGSSPETALPTCADLLDADDALEDGVYWVTPDDAEPFEVYCDMSAEGGGWIELGTDASQSMWMAHHSTGNPWRKCPGDSAGSYAWIVEDDVVADATGYTIHDFPVTYVRPDTGTPYTAEQVAALRDVVTELAESTRMVAVVADDDNGSWESDQSGGHEVYVGDPAGDLLLLTPGETGDCGGSSNWPRTSSAGTWTWHTTADLSVVEGDGITGVTSSDLGGLPVEYLLPHTVRLVVHTGGGSSFGWETETFLVR